MMRIRTSHFAALFATCVVLGAASQAQAANTPAILTTKANTVPVCVTPEHLMAFVGGRNRALPAKLREIAVDYKRHGEELHVRWDYAFFQMLVETNYLKFLAPGGKRGDVSPGQNNFAGLGATGHRAPGESFADVDTGVLAHLQHVRLYSGDPVETPVAERTRLVTDLILPWAQSLKRPVTFTDLTHKWAPSGHSYSDAIEGTADNFRQAYCTGNSAAATAGEMAKADGAADRSNEAVAEAAAQPVAKVRVAAKTKTVIESPVVAEAADTEAADATMAESADAPPLAGPAIKAEAKILKTAPKAATKVAVVAEKAPNVDGDGAADVAGEEATPANDTATATRADGTSPIPAASLTAEVTSVAGKAPKDARTIAKAAIDSVGTQAAAAGQAEAASETVSPAAKPPATKLAIAATVSEANTAETSAGQSVAVVSPDGGDGGAAEVVAPPAAKITAATTAKAVRKALANTADVTDKTPVAATTLTATEDMTKNTQMASLTMPATAAPSKNCKVFTASYGGGKSVLIQSMEGERTRFTALTVNEAKAEAQSKAFINVYAKGGQKIAEFGTQNEALTQAFQLCPEG